MKKRFTFTRLLQHFFQGVIVLAPIFFTGYVIYWAFTLVDSFFQVTIPHVGIIPGLGVLLVIVGIAAVGYLSSSFLVKRLFDLFDYLLERTPVIKYIYTSIKDVFDAFIGEKRKFDHPVLVTVYADDVWEIGFITQQDMSQFGLEEMMAVYVPMSYAISGKVYLLPRHKVRPLDNVSAADAMKFAVSGGVTALYHEHGSRRHPPEQPPAV
ncbi:DUF502 domain-containing protein [Compostibacter hankyongensis]|uniref:DUF502 domain-containing protein n=1 Tax=Compostibacter hankyongensis TaxID=1007089 RepID=A0ABP8FGU8_9BACT